MVDPAATAAASAEVAPEDPRVARSRVAIEEAAFRHFLEHGFHATRLQDVAREAAVSKRTIYNIYGDKEQLFREILAEAVRTAERFSTDVVAGLGLGDDVDDELLTAGLGLARAVLGGRVVPLRRLLISEAVRFPELAEDYYARAPGRVMTAIAEALQRYEQRGLLRVADADLAAEHFAFLVLGASLDRALFDAHGRSDPAERVELRAREGVAAFLRAYRGGRAVMQR
jgi:TetR/AcrR family transcriptional regulator, mexJK operon transcriptional repressor